MTPAVSVPFNDTLRGGGLPLALILAGSFVLNVTAIGWGMPSASGWAPDETLPQTMLGGIAQRFSGGWVSTYPAFHHYVLALAYLPTLALEWLRGAPIDLSLRHVSLVVSGRMVSVLMATATLAAIYLVAAEAFGRRAALFAALTLGLTTPFVYYAKTTNVDVPYVCWFAVSLVPYMRLLRALRLRDFVAFAVTATLAICTKDQAYALYALTPIPIGIALWRSGEHRSPWHLVIDRRVLAAGGAAAIAFAVGHNLLFNFSGFLEHLRLLTTWARYAPMFDTTVTGRAALSALAVRQSMESLGWITGIAAAAGLTSAVSDRRFRMPALCLLVPIVSYWLLFLNVIGYSFDRFMLPVCVVAAVFAGVGLARLVADGPLRRARQALCAAGLVFTALNPITLDLMMLFDARYAAEAWVERQLPAGRHVGLLGGSYLPRFERGQYETILTFSDLHRFRAPLIVVNADYQRLRPASTTERQILAALDQGDLGYRPIYSQRFEVPWQALPGLHPALVGERRGPVLSNLHHVNPRMEIFARDGN